MNIAVVLAGGTGSRMGADRPKQFLPLDGREVIEHSIDTFQESQDIDEIAVVVHPEWTGHMRELAQRRQWSKMKRIIPGGNERYMSSYNAVKAYAGYPDSANLLFHDAARPWISQDIVSRVCQALIRHEAVGTGIPSTDTIWQIHPDTQQIERIPIRSTMWRAQTPQAFRIGVIREAYERALQDSSFAFTDDCGVVVATLPEVAVSIVEGSEANRKITFANDL